MSISYNMHSYTGGHLGVIPSKRAFLERVKFVVEVVEVVVHVSKRDLTHPMSPGSTVVVHGDGSRSRQEIVVVHRAQHRVLAKPGCILAVQS